MRIEKPSIVLAALLVWNSVHAGDDRLIYTRADVAVAVTGEASLRRAYVTRVKLPWPDCSGDAFTCVEDVLYGQVYEVAFVEETMTRGPDSIPILERIDRGRVAIAVEFSADLVGSFEDALSDHLRTLAVASYSRAQAGTRYGDGALGQRTLLGSDLPAWVCVELDGSYTFNMIAREEQAFRSYSRTGDVARAGSRAIAAAVESALPDVYRTMPEIRSQVRREVRLAQASTLGGLTWADRLVQIPDGVMFEKSVLADDRKTGAIRDRRNGQFIGHEGRHAGVERDVRLSPASFNVVEAPMWVARWTFGTIRETLGDAPIVGRASVESIVVAVLPIADPLMEELERPERPLFVPGELLIERAIVAFEREATLGPDNVVEALSDPELWPSGGDWLMLVCTDDGAGRYGIAPFANAAEIENSRDACAIIRRAIAS